MAGAPGIIILFAGIFLPDSPNSLAERGNVEKAKEVSLPFPFLGSCLWHDTC